MSGVLLACRVMRPQRLLIETKRSRASGALMPSHLAHSRFDVPLSQVANRGKRGLDKGLQAAGASMGARVGYRFGYGNCDVWVGKLGKHCVPHAQRKSSSWVDSWGKLLDR